MLPRDYIKAHTNNASIKIEGVGHTTFTFIASNLATATPPGETGLTSINFAKKETGIIVIHVWCTIIGTKSNTSVNYPMLLEVAEGKVTESQFWQPKIPERLLSIVNTQEYGHSERLRVTSETGACYTDNPTPEAGDIVVPNAKLLCEYVVGEVSGETLQKAALHRLEELSAREELPKLRGAWADLEIAYATLQFELESTKKELDQECALATEIVTLIQAAQGNLPWWVQWLYNEALEPLDTAVKKLLDAPSSRGSVGG